MNLVALGLGVFLITLAVYTVSDLVNRGRPWISLREYERDPTGAKEEQRMGTVIYKAAWQGIPSDDVDPEYTSQQCPICGHTERANRHKKRFKCCECEHQDHADRGAGVSVAQKWLRKQEDRNVPALNTLPQVQKWELRRQASGPVDGPTVASDTVRGDQTDGIRGVSD